MQKSSPRLYIAAVLLTLTLSAFSFAGDVHCPFIPPPPPEEGRSTTPIINAADAIDVHLTLTGIWEFLAESTDVF
jgi:hypothetical protein